MSKKIKKFGHLYFMLLFPVAVIYYELLFRIATVGGVFKLSTVYMLLFSIAYGGIGYLLSSLSKNRKTNRIVSACLIGATSIPYIVEYLIYRFFKTFYDIGMVTGTAGDAATTYTAEIFQLILTSIPVLILFFVPLAFYLIFGSKLIPAYRSNAVVRIISGLTTVLTYVLASLLIMVSSIYAPMYKAEYNFRSAVENFGLISGLRLDAKYLILGRESSFDIDNPPTPDDPPVDTPVEYGYNKLELDFEALNEGASSKIKKLNAYVSSLTPSKKNEYTGLFKGKNLIMISAEAFTAEVIDPTLTPTLYRLANKGIQFTDYYQPSSAGTTGGEYQNVFGMLPMAGGSSFKNTAKTLNYYTMGSQLDRLGYFGKAYHNNSYTYYDRNKTHKNLGYSEGFMGMGNGMEQYVSRAWPQSDLEMFKGTLTEYIDKQPFNIYYMSVSGHSAYTRTGNSMTSKNWDKVKDLPYSDTVKGYLAANLELENALTHMVSELELKGIADDTVIVISTDHFPYGLDDGGTFGNMPYLSELYGYNVNDYFKRDHNRLILWSGCLEKMEPIVVDSPTFSLDILPTLSNLFGTEFDSRLMPGRDVFSDAPALVYNTNYDWKTDLGTYYSSKGKFVPVNDTVTIPEGYVESMKTVVRNKINYCSQAPASDYYRHIFG
ncbi:MAG: sulfatase-like hydrolase/transferase [Clostridia bacterium]|nr:sulfatase-like hydrolase/transferase [Clostridia bacterium]